jgi:hypothetical protein
VWPLNPDVSSLRLGGHLQGCPDLGQVGVLLWVWSCCLAACLTGASLQLLTVNPEHRFSSLQDMQAAPSLANVLWDDLSEKKVEPGFVPNVSLCTHMGSSSQVWWHRWAGLSRLSLHRKAACTATPPLSWRR